MKNILNLNNSNHEGFTLLEIMVAIAIMAIALTSVLKLYTQTVAMNMASNFYAKAPLLAQKIISEWETGMAQKGLIPTLNDSIEGFPGFTFEITHGDVVSDVLYSEHREEDGRLVEIKCTIIYNQGEYRYTTKTLKLITP